MTNALIIYCIGPGDRTLTFIQVNSGVGVGILFPCGLKPSICTRSTLIITVVFTI